MAEDALGRPVGELNFKTAMNSLNGKVTTVLETRDSNAETVMAKVVDAVREVAKRIDANAQADAANAENFAQSVIETHKQVFAKEPKSSNKKSDKTASLDGKLSRKGIEKIVKMGASPNTFWVGVGHFHSQAIKQLKNILIDCGLCGSTNRMADALNAATKSNNVVDDTNDAVGAGGGGGNNNGGTPGAGVGSTAGPGAGGGFNNALNRIQVIGYWLSALTTKLGDMFETKLTDTFKGVLINSNRFRENLRATLFQTQGFVETNREIEKSFIDIKNSIISSGVSSAQFEKIWVDNLQRGMGYMSKTEKGTKSQSQVLQRQIKIHKSVQTSALSTASALNMSAEATNDTFMNWHLQLGMSSNELAYMGRSMKQISMSTGVTGANLERAMKSADSVMKVMRSTGALTDVAAKNVLEMTTLAQKYGIEDSMNPMLQAMSGGHNWFNADKNLTGSLVRMAVHGGNAPEDLWKLRSGGILEDKAALGRLAGGGRKLASVALRSAGVDPTNVDFTQLTKLMKNMTEQQKATLQTQMKIMTGQDIGDFERQQQLLMDMQKTEGDKLKDLDSQIANAKKGNNKVGESDATKALIRKREEMETNNVQTMFGKISDLMSKEGKSFGEAEALVRAQLKNDFGADYTNQIMNNMGGSANKLIQGINERANKSGVKLNELLGRRGSSEAAIKDALTSGTGDERHAASEILNEAMQEIAQYEKTNSDPIAKINEGIRLINNKLEQIVNRMFFGSDFLVQAVFWIAKIGGLVASALTFLAYLPSILALLAGARGVGMVGQIIAGARAGGAAGAVGAARNIITGGATAAAATAATGAAAGTAGTAAATGAAAGTAGTAAATGAAAGTAGTAAKAAKSGFLQTGLKALKSKPGKAGLILAGAALLSYGAYSMFGKKKEEPLSEAGNATMLDGVQQVFVTNWPDCICADNRGAMVAGTMQPNIENGVVATTEAEQPLTTTDYALTGLTSAFALNEFKNLIAAQNAIKAGLMPAAKTTATGVLGKGLSLLQVGMGGYQGYSQAEEAGLSKLTATTLGAITGSAKSGTENGTISGLVSSGLGFQRGGNADEMVGAYGSMGQGALIGAQFGGIGGAAIGAGVGGAAEISKVLIQGNQVADNLKLSSESMVAGYQTNQQQLIYDKSMSKQGEDPVSKLADLNQLLASKKSLLAGQESNLTNSTKEFNSRLLPSWINPATRASKFNMNADQQLLETTQITIAQLEEQIMRLNSAAKIEAVAASSNLGIPVDTQLNDSLNSAISQNAKPISDVSGGIGLGLFDKENAGGAMDVGIGTSIKEKQSQSDIQMSGIIDVGERLIDALYCVCDSNHQKSDAVNGGMNLGLFDRENASGAMTSGIGTMISSIVSPVNMQDRLFNAHSKKANAERADTPLADVGKSLYYAEVMQTQIGGAIEALMQTHIGQLLGELIGVKGETSTNLLDYSDDTKGSVSTSMFNMSDTENRVAQEKYGSMPSGGMIPGMEGIEGYLAAEQNLLKRVIQVLESIDQNTAGRSGTSVVGARSNGTPSNAGMKMRKISQEQSAGQWDITFGDYSPSHVTTEGRR